MKSKGFTLIELLVVIAIIAILAAILFPVFTNARIAAEGTACLSNCKSLALAMGQYADNWNDRFPTQAKAEGDANSASGWEEWYTGSGWCKKLYPYVRSSKVYECPVSRGYKKNGVSSFGNVSYLVNGVFCCTAYPLFGQPRLRGVVRNPSKVVLIWEGGQPMPVSRAYPNRTNSVKYFDMTNILGMRLHVHNNVATFVFLDCHAKQMDVACKYSMFDDRLRP